MDEGDNKMAQPQIHFTAAVPAYLLCLAGLASRTKFEPQTFQSATTTRLAEDCSEMHTAYNGVRFFPATPGMSPPY
eukprot:scaffold3855_cov199-Alexandrium_tamarense.AAC.43